MGSNPCALRSSDCLRRGSCKPSWTLFFNDSLSIRYSTKFACCVIVHVQLNEIWEVTQLQIWWRCPWEVIDEICSLRNRACPILLDIGLEKLHSHKLDDMRKHSCIIQVLGNSILRSITHLVKSVKVWCIPLCPSHSHWLQNMDGGQRRKIEANRPPYWSSQKAVVTALLSMKILWDIQEYDPNNAFSIKENMWKRTDVKYWCS